MIELSENYKIDADKYQYILHTRKATTHEKAKSDFTWSQSYHANIEQVAKAITDSGLKGCIEAGGKAVKLLVVMEEYTEKLAKLIEELSK